MADAANAPVPTFQTIGTNSMKAKWVMAGTSTGRPIRYADFADKSIQAFGTWGAATLVFEGSMDDNANPDSANYANSVWGTLTDTTETPLSTTVDLIPTQTLQFCEWVRPKTTGGTGTAVTFYLGAKS
jgi:hypothetical protein